MTKQELIQNLLEYKSHLKNTYCDLDAIIRDTTSDVCDYNADNDYELDSYTYRFETYDGVEEFIMNTLHEWGILTLKHRLSEIDGDYEYYRIDDVDGTIYGAGSDDVEEWIDDILDTLGYEEDETTD